MGARVELQSLLEEVLGSRNVYFQPPSDIHMKYPAIVYARSRIANDHANDDAYRQSLSYELTVIDANPDSEIVTKISKLPMCRHDRHFTSDNLNHDVFTIYY